MHRLHQDSSKLAFATASSMISITQVNRDWQCYELQLQWLEIKIQSSLAMVLRRVTVTDSKGDGDLGKISATQMNFQMYIFLVIHFTQPVSYINLQAFIWVLQIYVDLPCVSLIIKCQGNCFWSWAYCVKYWYKAILVNINCTVEMSYNSKHLL